MRTCISLLVADVSSVRTSTISTGDPSLGSAHHTVFSAQTSQFVCLTMHWLALVGSFLLVM